MIHTLNAKFGSFLEHKFFKTVIGFIIFMNPLAIAPQLYSAATAPTVEGVAVSTWIVFAAIQIAAALEGVRVRSFSMFGSMGISFFMSIAIILLVLIRG